MGAFRSVTAPTFAYIQIGPAGSTGQVLVPLSINPAFEYTGCAPATTAQIRAIERNPRGFYLNVNSKRSPLGAVRGQL